MLFRSIPINILDAISGTKLEKQPQLNEEEIFTTISIFRFINPTAYLRLAGGRHLLKLEAQKKALEIGINACITGGLLTTTGTTTTNQDKIMFNEQYRN